MCGFTPSPAASRSGFTPESAAAFEDLRLGIARYIGCDPDEVELTICRPQPWEIESQEETND